MDDKQLEAHVDALEKLFPKVFLQSTDDFYGWDSGGKQGIWTGFGESGHYDSYPPRGGAHIMYKRLQKYVDDNDLFLEPHDAGTIMIWSALE